MMKLSVLLAAIVLFQASGINSYVSLGSEKLTLGEEDFYNYEFHPTDKSISVTHTTNMDQPGPCEGYVLDVHLSQYIYNCSLNADCNACEDFTVENLHPGISYLFNIRGKTGVHIYGYVKTQETTRPYFKAKFSPSVNSIDVEINTNIDHPAPCTGYVLDTTVSEYVFDCAADRACRGCRSFTVKDLKPGVEYMFNIYGQKGARIFEHVTTPKRV